MTTGVLYLDEGTQNYDVHHNVASDVYQWLRIWATSIKNHIVRYNYSDTPEALDNGVSNAVIDEHQKIPLRNVQAFEAVAVWMVLSALYLLTLAGNHTESEDALMYLSRIRSGDVSGIFDPYHLIYGWYAWTAYHAALALGYSGGPLLPAQVLDAFTGALGIALLWHLLRTAIPNRVAAVAGCGLLAFSYGYWWYSVEADVYILSVLLLICSFYLAYRAVTRPSWKSFALVGGAHGLAVLAHNTNVLFMLVIIVSLLSVLRSLPLGGVARCTLAYVGASIVVVVPPYLLAFVVVGLRTPNEVYGWLTGYVHSGNWGTWEMSNLPKAAIGLGRALVGGHFAFSLGPLRDIVLDSFASNSLREELFLVRNFPSWLALFLFVLVVGLAIALLLPLLKWWRQPTLNRQTKTLMVLCISWFVPYALFFVWWEPQNIEFWIAPWVPLAILFSLLFSTPEYETSRHFLSSWVVVLAFLFIANLLGSVWPQHDPKDDYWRVRSSWYEHHTSSSDLAVTAGPQASRYLRYFSPAEVIDIEEIPVEHNDVSDPLIELDRRIDKSRAHRVLFSSEAFYPSSDRFSRCTNAELCNELAPAVRDKFLPRTRIVSHKPLETVRELNRQE